jgi:hypothetical protein
MAVVIAVVRSALTQRCSAGPHALEAVKVEGGHLPIGITYAEYGCLRSRHAIGVLIDEKLLVSAVDRIV